MACRIKSECHLLFIFHSQPQYSEKNIEKLLQGDEIFHVIKERSSKRIEDLLDKAFSRRLYHTTFNETGKRLMLEVFHEDFDKT